ncbi:outer membrane protein assembly factor BamB [Luteimonas terricola]|uniref:Outer membrane protein assembly factor BamB n=1 Tax=Luteimonas terricola TaxID=645597 RepID=A0ABQ2EFP3_9GAMM|nr:outer membrane protein assembly factor BamB [Luteimonas terricola]
MTVVPPIRQHRHARIAARTMLVLACIAMATGCSTMRGWFSSNDDKADTEPAKLVDFQSSATPSRIWTASAGKGDGRTGVAQAPTIADGNVYAASVKGGVRAFDLQSGRSLWHHDSDLRLSGGPGAGDGLVVAGSLDGEVVALDAATGALRWTATVPNEVITRPAVGQGLVVVRSNDGRVTALDAASGERRWFWVQDLPPLTVRGNAPVTLAPGFAFIGTDEGSLLALALSDGRVAWEQPVGIADGRTELERMADVDGAPVVDGAVVIASSYKNSTVAFEGPSGRPLWAAESGGAGGVGVASDRLVVSDSAGRVWGIDKYVGTSYWQQPALVRRNLAPAAVHGDYAVVGDLEGYLHWMRLSDGEFAARTRASRSAIAGRPAVADGILVVQDVDGDLSAWRID